MYILTWGNDMFLGAVSHLAAVSQGEHSYFLQHLTVLEDNSLVICVVDFKVK